MVADRTDEEQIEAIKKWWADNGTSTIVGVVAALAVVFGYQAWQNHARETGEAASAIYANMLEAVTLESPFAPVDQQKLSTGRFLANQLKDEYSATSYAHLAALFLAKIAVDEGDLPAAERELNWALDHGISDSLTVIAKIRLARVKSAQGDQDAALAVLASVVPGEYRPSYEEAKGDIYLKKGDIEQAREAYQRAVTGLPEGDSRPMLQMKLDDLVTPTNVLPVEEPADVPTEGEAK